ncbi:MAG: BBP7 family outer membrane beta-barrel protein [Pirellulales bacterium]
MSASRASAQGDLYFTANSLFLHNTNPAQQVVSQHAPGGESARLFTDSSHFTLQPGVELTLGKYCDPITAVEISYFGLQQWNGGAVTTDPTQSLFTPFSRVGAFLGDFNNAYQQGFNTSAQTHNVEINLRRHLTQPIVLIAGIRYLNYHERFNYFSVEDRSPNSDIGRYDINATNHALGVQIGTEAHYLVLDWLELGGTFKSGMFVNWVEQDTTLINNNATFAQGGQSDTALMGVVDFNLMATVIHGNWRFSAGYRALLMSGMARASDQLDFSINEDPAAVTGNVNHQGTVVLHGPWAGVTFIY